MSEKNLRSINTFVPNDGSYLGAKAGKALKDKSVMSAAQELSILPILAV